MNEKPKSMIEDAQATATWLVMLIHASVVPLRLFSRVPGSMGAGYLFPGVLWGYAVMGVIPPILFGDTQGERVLFPLFVTVTGWLWLLHLLAYRRSHANGKGTYAWHTGIGWMNKMFPKADPGLMAMYSDMFTAFGLGALFFLGGDPVYGAGMMLTIVPMFISDFLIEERDKARQRRFRSSMDNIRHQQELMRDSLGLDDME